MRSESDSLFSNALELSQQSDLEPPEIEFIQEISVEEETSIDQDTRDVSLEESPLNHVSEATAREIDSLISSSTERKPVQEDRLNSLVELMQDHFLQSDRVVLITSGTKSKSRKIPKSMRLNSIIDIVKSQPHTLRSEAVPAKDLYTGKVPVDLNHALEVITQEYDIDHLIISPLYGLMSPDRKIVPYDCSFADKPYYIQVQMAVRANIPFRLQQTILQPEYDVVILALPKSYQVILDLLSFQAIAHKTVYRLKVTNSGYDLITLGL